MEKRRILGVLALAVITAVTAGVEYTKMAAQRQEAAEHRAFLAAAPLAQVEGETLSPNGRFQVRTAGKSEMYVSGYVVPEFLQIVDTETGEILWQDQGALWQSALWSPANNLVAIAYGGRTWTQVKVISTACWISWDFTLPDGSPIPEYEFLPEDWGTWLDMDTLLLTVGRGGDAGEPHTYRCTVRTNQDGTLSGSALEQTTEVLAEDYDFDHDGMPETTELVTVLTPEADYYPAWYILQVIRQDGVELWSAGAHPSHAGWTSVFACKIDGEDYLLQYEPEMYQGWGEYAYRLFHPYIISPASNEPAEQVLREGAVTWDLNFGREGHHLNAAALADFLEEVHGYLDQSTLLLSTEGGEVRTGGSGADFRSDMDFWDDLCPYDEALSLQENLENLERSWTAAQQALEIT